MSEMANRMMSEEKYNSPQVLEPLYFLSLKQVKMDNEYNVLSNFFLVLKTGLFSYLGYEYLFFLRANVCLFVY